MTKIAQKYAQKYPILNNKYEVIEKLGSGKTSNVYLCREINNHSNQVVVKKMCMDYLEKSSGQDAFISEVIIQKGLDHPNINKFLEVDFYGKLKQPQKLNEDDIIYSMMEYIPKSQCFFDFSMQTGALGEDGARYLINQIISGLEYMHNNQVIHRDIKLENMLIDDNLKIQLIDFGFSTNQKINQLNDLMGTKTYMAPEIRDNKVYDGKQIDIFSLGVVLFSITAGHFPIQQASLNDEFYSHLAYENYKQYWQSTFQENTSEDFKDLIQKMLSYYPKERPSIKDLKSHKWITKEYDIKQTIHNIKEKLNKNNGQQKQKKSADLKCEEIII